MLSSIFKSPQNHLCSHKLFHNSDFQHRILHIQIFNKSIKHLKGRSKLWFHDSVKRFSAKALKPEGPQSMLSSTEVQRARRPKYYSKSIPICSHSEKFSTVSYFSTAYYDVQICTVAVCRINIKMTFPQKTTCGASKQSWRGVKQRWLARNNGRSHWWLNSQVVMGGILQPHLVLLWGHIWKLTVEKF